jgi:lipopolysaccharide export LptBFGC system permease protein LptF
MFLMCMVVPCMGFSVFTFWPKNRKIGISILIGTGVGVGAWLGLIFGVFT